ncbi:mannose-1-phosphate guanyltransferase [Methylacidiphilum sp. Yel]|uniref:mannose-1-phosphate guanylyltransferase n=1 Tax=Methylacidiphilum sp. Yel TaxID=1847730 RepID=UPI00106B81D9|nr:sugar phosphate nucleotidyltransferase [Methylacidiphilum sp. Yel]TFE68978.1 mannose-1-phosphate guanyltransferase [Methylacidiphilum sp. Yel]
MDNVFVFILAGGSGERFWPVSRRNTPKHLISFFSDKTLLEETINRIKGLVPEENLYILSNKDQLSSITKRLPSFPLEKILFEPEKRDTAAASTLATAIAARHSNEATVVLLPADSKINNREIFRDQLLSSVLFAQETKSIVAFSIPPNYPATGFGYLKLDKTNCFVKNGEKFFPVIRFVEKPSVDAARRYIKEEDCGWNSGMYIWTVKVFIEEIQRWAFPFYHFILEYLEKPLEWESAFIRLPKISIDYALMEKTDKIFAMEARFDWNDLGSWVSVAEYFDKDEEGNRLKGKMCAYDAKENIVLSDSKLVALCGVNDLVVIESEQAILVCHKDKIHELKKLYEKLPQEFK